MNIITSLDPAKAPLKILQWGNTSPQEANGTEAHDPMPRMKRKRPVSAVRQSSAALSPTNLRAQELYKQAVTSPASPQVTPQDHETLSHQYLLLKRSLFLNPTSTDTYTQMIHILRSHFLDTKESLVLARRVSELRDDENLGFLDTTYYGRDAGAEMDLTEQPTTLERDLFNVQSAAERFVEAQNREPASPVSPFAYQDEEKLLEDDVPTPSAPLLNMMTNADPITTTQPINASTPSPSRPTSYLHDYILAELEYIELLDEQSMRFVMERKFEQAKFCLEDAAKKLDTIDKELLATLHSPSPSASPLKHSPLANILSLNSQTEKKPHLLFEENVSTHEYMSSIFSANTLPTSERKSLSKKCRKLHSTLVMHFAVILVYLGQYQHAEQCLNTLPEHFVQARILKAQLYLKYTKDLKKSKRELDYLWRNHKEVKNVSDLRDVFRATIKDKKVRGTQLLISKQYHEALKIFGETIEAFPADFHLYFKRAQCLRHLKLYPAAVKDLFECINLCGGSNEEAEQALGDSLYEMGMELMKLGTVPNAGALLRHLGNTVYQKPEAYLRDAISYFTESLKWHNDYRYLLARGDCHVALKEHENALKDFLKAKKMSHSAESVLRKIASLHNEWSKILFNEKKFDMAEEELTRSLEIFRENSTVYLNRAKVRFRLRKHADAVQDVVAAFLLDRTNEEAVQLVKQYVPTVLADPDYQNKFRQKLFAMKESVQMLMSEKEVNAGEVAANRRLSRRDATASTLIEKVQLSQKVLARVPSSGSVFSVPSEVETPVQPEDLGLVEKNAEDKNKEKVVVEEQPQKEVVAAPAAQLITPVSRSSVAPRPTTAPATTRGLPPKSPATRPQTAGTGDTPNRRLSATLTQTTDSPRSPQARTSRPQSSTRSVPSRISNRDRLSLSRQLQYANAKLIRPLSAAATQAQSPSMNKRRASATHQTFAQHAHERFRARKNEKMEVKTPVKGLKQSARLSEMFQSANVENIVIGSASGNAVVQSMSNGHVHKFS